MSEILGKVCTACGAERKKKDMIAYHPETFLPYCVSAYFCNDEHPNSAQNIIDRGGELKLLDLDEARDAYQKYVESTLPNPQKIMQIRKMVSGPMTLRIVDPQQAEFLVNLQDKMNFASMSDTIRFCIQQTSDNMNRAAGKNAEAKQTVQEEKNFHSVVEKPEKQTKAEPEEVPSDMFNF